jgi:hypothetical protein
MSKEKLLSAQTKAELIKTIGVLRRHEARLLRDIDRLNAKVDKLETNARNPGWRDANQDAVQRGELVNSHVTPLPANAYGPFPWEPKQP